MKICIHNKNVKYCDPISRLLTILGIWGFHSLSVQGAVVYSTIPASLANSYDSHAFYAQKTDMLGNYVELGGTERYLNAITVTMVTWAKAADHLAYTNPAGWNHDLTVVLYSVGPGDSPTLTHLASKTNQNQLIPWKPTDIPTNGKAFNVTFNFDGNVQLPDRFVIGITYKTMGHGFYANEADPELTSPGPYNELNVGMRNVSPTAGAEVLLNNPVTPESDPTDYVFIVNDTAGATLYGQPDAGRDPMIEIQASAAPTSSLSPYDTWIQSYLNTNGVSPALRNEDPDRDGLSNLTEFAFGTDPTNNSPNPITISRSSNAITITWLQRNDGAATYTNRSTTNLTTGFPPGNSPNFQPGPSTNQTILPRPQYTRYQFATNPSAFLRHFYRVDAQEAP